MGDFRIPNNWDAIGQALSEAVGAGPKATQLLEENNRAIEDAISSSGAGLPSRFTGLTSAVLDDTHSTVTMTYTPPPEATVYMALVCVSVNIAASIPDAIKFWVNAPDFVSGAGWVGPNQAVPSGSLPAIPAGPALVLGGVASSVAARWSGNLPGDFANVEGRVLLVPITYP